MKATPIATTIFRAGDRLEDFVYEFAKPFLKERCVLAVTSKIVSLAEGRLVPKSTISKPDLIRQESDVFMGESNYGVYLTIKHGLLIPSAGIDESNSEHDHYILYPEKPFQSAQRLYQFLRDKTGIKELGVVLTDSRSLPLRRGVTGFALAYWGFAPLRNLIGQKDLFDRPIKATQVNLPDALAGAAVLVMGETDEAQPVAVVEYDRLEFADSAQEHLLQMSPTDDLYGPLFATIKV